MQLQYFTKEVGLIRENAHITPAMLRQSVSERVRNDLRLVRRPTSGFWNESRQKTIRRTGMNSSTVQIRPANVHEICKLSRQTL